VGAAGLVMMLIRGLKSQGFNLEGSWFAHGPWEGLARSPRQQSRLLLSVTPVPAISDIWCPDGLWTACPCFGHHRATGLRGRVRCLQQERILGSARTRLVVLNRRLVRDCLRNGDNAARAEGVRAGGACAVHPSIRSPIHITFCLCVQRFFAKYEFKAPHLLCCSDCEPLSVEHLLSLADPDSKHRYSTHKSSASYWQAGACTLSEPSRARVVDIQLYSTVSRRSDMPLCAFRWSSLKLSYTDSQGLPVRPLLRKHCA
jgi:hypothetical protein